ncbi:unnamed protein product [Brassicogethes aeneus]|uniref:VWFA domain-containing protein n=1 Tax=Brassicogethes aeneus TaxID=1431903 RepID=A0A9P0API7_BRAAE|nr:unnamed protein product [Brassicogethes aeneus]
MAFETTVFCLDNSDFTLIEDHVPNRIYVECQGIHLICVSKTLSNPSNYFGLVAMANVEILAPLTQNYNEVLSKSKNLKLHEQIDFVAGLHLAYSMLIKRPNKESKMKLIAFIASPCIINEKQLRKLAKILKRSKVTVEIIFMDQHPDTLRKMFDFTMDLNGDNNLTNNVVIILPDTNIASAIRSSQILPFTYITADVEEEQAYFLLAMRISLQEKEHLDAGTSAAIKVEDSSNMNVILEDDDKEEDALSQEDETFQSVENNKKK